MQQNLKIFLLVAQEKSISKAAEKAFVTQQCVSDHIHRLEQQYQTKLFHRDPHFSLTEAGQLLHRALLNIRTIETKTQEEISKLSQGISGSFTFGISTSRAQILLPRILPQYYKQFPDVSITFEINDTVILEEKLKRGELDLFLGINADLDQGNHVELITHDRMFFIISDTLLRQYFPDEKISTFSQGVDLKNFSHIPFCMYKNTGSLNILIRQHFISHGIVFHNTPYYVSDCDTHINLCQSGLSCSIIPLMLADSIFHRKHQENPIHIYPIKNFSYALRVDLVSQPHMEKPLYMKSFIDILTAEITAIEKSYPVL